MNVILMHNTSGQVTSVYLQYVFCMGQIVKFCQNCENFVEIMMSEHCVRHCMLIMVCGIVLGKAKPTKVSMV